MSWSFTPDQNRHQAPAHLTNVLKAFQHKMPTRLCYAYILCTLKTNFVCLVKSYSSKTANFRYSLMFIVFVFRQQCLITQVLIYASHPLALINFLCYPVWRNKQGFYFHLLLFFNQTHVIIYNSFLMRPDLRFH